MIRTNLPLALGLGWKMSRNTHVFSLPANGQLTAASYSGSCRQRDAGPKRKGECSEMRRRMILLLTTMAMALVVASGTAMAEPQLDQQQTSADGRIQVTSRGAFQTFTAGKTGKLDKVSIYIGCCGAEGVPTSDLRVEVLAATSAHVMIPASSFTNNGTLNWVDVSFGSAAPTVQAGQDRKSTRLNSSHANISYAVFCLKKKNK